MFAPDWVRGGRELAGRLGFEPRQSAPKALDLPLVDRPVNLLARQRFVRRSKPSPCEHRAPILRPRQGFRKEGLASGGLNALLSSPCIFLIPVQPKEGGA